jgi:hypothetical protein
MVVEASSGLSLTPPQEPKKYPEFSNNFIEINLHLPGTRIRCSDSDNKISNLQA